jgi:deoxyribose-phosphate aldolase
MTENVTITRAELARMIDDTLLTPEATDDDVTRLAQQASRLGVGAICVSPSRLPLAPGLLPPGTGVAAVVGFPSGAHLASVKAAEAAAAVAAGATQIDMVIDLGFALEDNWKPVTAEIAAVRAAIGPDVTLKAILETAVIGLDRIGPACQAAEAGGATVEAVRAMAAAVGGRLGVKASGGIRTTADALAMIAAGATRIGASATAAILGGLPDE